MRALLLGLARWGRATCAAALALTLALEVAISAGEWPRERLEPREESTRIYDRHGELLRERVASDGARMQWVSLEEVAPEVVDAIVAVEDARFFHHRGVDLRGVARAALDGAAEERIVSGASTITMQLVRLIAPHPKKGLGAKLGEMLDAWRLERVASKAEILEQYLNRAPFSGGTIGIEAASQRWLGKPASHLSTAEAAFLAGLPQAPGRLDPRRHLDRALQRQRHVLARMVEVGRLDAAGLLRALEAPIHVQDAPPRPRSMHGTELALARAGGGGRLSTTLDGDLEAEVRAMMRAHLATREADGVTNAAVIVLENETCEIHAMVGSADYADPRGGAINGALAKRQPGSTLKPFTYALAWEAGASPGAVVADVPTVWSGPGGRRFAPENYDGRFAGPIMMREALGRSLNVPALKAAERVGARALLQGLRRMGFGSLSGDAEVYGLGLTLGNGEVTLLELAEAYAMLARGGRACSARLTSAPADAGGAERVMDEALAWLVGEALRDEAARVAAFGPDNALMLGFPVAVKTGTSANWRDNWTVGYTPTWTVAVWAGDFAGRSLEQLSGSVGAGPLFHRVMKRVAGESGDRRAATAPKGVRQVALCPVSGLRPGRHCPHSVEVAVADAHAALHAATCGWHRRVRIDTRNGLRAGPGCPRAFTEERAVAALPEGYQEWAERQPRQSLGPTRWSPLCPREGREGDEGVVITSPRDGATYLLEPGGGQRLLLAAKVTGDGEGLSWWVDGEEVAALRFPYRAVWQVDARALKRGAHRVEVKRGGQALASVSVSVR